MSHDCVFSVALQSVHSCHFCCRAYASCGPYLPPVAHNILCLFLRFSAPDTASYRRWIHDCMDLSGCMSTVPHADCRTPTLCMADWPCYSWPILPGYSWRWIRSRMVCHLCPLHMLFQRCCQILCFYAPLSGLILLLCICVRFCEGFFYVLYSKVVVFKY